MGQGVSNTKIVEIEADSKFKGAFVQDGYMKDT